MVRLIIIAIIAYAAFWCCNNLDFSKIADNTKNSIQNEKTIKAVRNERQTNYSNEQSVVDNNY